MIQWRKSSHSQGECVEVSVSIAGTTLIRDSRNPDGPRLTLTRSDLADLLGRIKSGGVG
ncbi:DUF397 domain-containing protein [Actinomadura sp. 9N407]|uniref:DUF397 domain-containing protein n=1 Tax=Actinomadura sp. 9N407 TaxID=3375154 RepID=UPI0037B87A4E